MSVRSTTSRTTGKAYVEFTMGQVSSGGLTHIGLANPFWDYTNPETLGLDGNSFGYESDGAIFVAGARMGSADSFGASDVIQLCVDFDNRLFWVAKNNDPNWNGASASPAAGTGGISFYAVPGSCLYAGYCSANADDSVSANFGGSSFQCTVPSGFSAWNSNTTQTIWDPNAEDGMTLSNNNLTATVTATGIGGMSVRSLTFWNAGKAYVEFAIGQVSSNGLTRIGVGNSWWNVTRSETLGFDGNSFEYESDGYIFIADSNMAQADTFGADDVVQLCVDFDRQLFWVTKNNDGNWNGTGADPVNGTGGIGFSSIPGPWFVGYCSATVGDCVTVNFGASAFRFPIPQGFSAWGGGFGGGIVPRPAALASYPSWKQYANWEFGSNQGNNIQSGADLYAAGWVHSHETCNNSDEVELFIPLVDNLNRNIQPFNNYIDFVAIWNGQAIHTDYHRQPNGNVTSMQVELPLDTTFPPLTSITYVEGRFKCPGVRGSWPAFWTVGHWMNCGKNGCSGDDDAWGPEIDIMEVNLPTNTSGGSTNFSDPAVFDATLHCGSEYSDSYNKCFIGTKLAKNVPPGYTDNAKVTYGKWGAGQWNLGYLHMNHFVNSSDGYHRYGCLIEPDHTISIWIDNQKMGHFDATQYDHDNGVPVALQLLIDLALNAKTTKGNFHEANYTGPLNKYRLGIKNVQIWGPKGG